MGFNRIADREIDAANPRTASREIPAGTIKVSTAWVFTLSATALFVGSAGALGRRGAARAAVRSAAGVH